MSTVSAIGASALRVAEMRLDAAASNIANAQTSGRIPQGQPQSGDIYQPVDVVQVDTGSGAAAQYVRRSPGYSVVASPDSPAANADGPVAMPDVEIGTELANVALARIAYGAALRVLRADSAMQRDAVDQLA